MFTEASPHQPLWLDASRPREGRYVLGPLLGKGGMGEVVEAWDVILCRTVALKILRNMEPTALIRFMHEAQIQARVAHPHICRIYDVDSSEGTVKIAMQLIRGPNLEQACRDLSQSAKVTLVAEVAEAVHAAHALKLIHRDLKPSNILLEKGPNDRWLPYLCDFGLAMSMDEPALTATGGAIGTPAYMAPEQFHGERGRIGPTTDVYGLGGTLHFALLGRPPDGPTHGLRMNILFPESTGYPPPTDDLPVDLRIIILKCLEEDPALRYPSAGALAEDLWRFLRGEPVQATPPGALQRFWRRHRRRLRLSLGSAAVLAALAGGWSLEGFFLGRVQQRRLEVARALTLEGDDLEDSIRMERFLPAHDLRSANRWFQTRLGVLRARTQALGAPAQAPGHLALARAELALGEARQALEEASLAWQASPRAPETAYLLATATAWAALAPGTRPGPDGAETAQQVEALFKLGRDMGPDALPRALVAYLRGDFATAASVTAAVVRTSPWDLEAVKLEAYSHCAMAIQRFDAADLPGAEFECRQAMAGVHQYLETGRSDGQAYHAYFMAARWLLSIQADQGDFPTPQGRVLETLGDQTLRLNPEDPDLQEDWLSLRFLMARHAHQDRGGAERLMAALAFLGTRVKGPLTPGLDNARMLILWAQAEALIARKADPKACLAEALKAPAPAPALRREYLGQVFNCKAREEAARGIDPRPTLDLALARFQSRLKDRPGWSLLETVAEGWLIRGQWEGAHGLEAADSLRQCEALLDQALVIHPASRSAQALLREVRKRQQASAL